MAMDQIAATLIVDDKPNAFDRAAADARGLWLDARELASKTGWELKPEGFCRGELCMPLPPARETEFSRKDGDSTLLNFTALADAVGKPWAADAKHQVWYIGTEPAARANALRTRKAPDFELPDVDGNLHRLSDHRGKKVFLLAWASW